jgi:predicted nuclease with TOPRIM domain
VYNLLGPQHLKLMSQESKNKITFADLDTFLKIAPIIGLAILAYLQTLFPSKAEFEKLENHLIQMDKKITEMTVLQKAITSNSGDIKQMDNRLRFLEVEMARHNAQEAASTNAGRKGAVR